MEYLLEFIKNIDWTKEWLGMLAMTITLYSFSIKYSLQFRQVNIFAAFLWIAYGVQINSGSVLVSNLVIALLHFYHLFNHYSGRYLLQSKKQK